MPEEYTIQSNYVTLSNINFKNIYEKRLINAFIDSLSPLLKEKIEVGVEKGMHIKEQREFEFEYNKSIIYTYNLSDVEPNPQNYNRLKAAIKKLRRTDIDIITPDGTEIYTGLIEMATLNTFSEVFRVKLSLTAYQFLCDMSKGYSLKSFKTAISLKSLYSSSIYELLCKWRNKPQFHISLEDIRFVTNTLNKYPNTKDLKKRVLDSAKKELDASDITDLTFTYEDVKNGRSISAFIITIQRTNNDKLKANNLIKQTSPNWDFSKEIINFLNRNKINFNGVNRDLFKNFFKKNGENKGLIFLEDTKDLALRTSRDNPQGYVISAVKKNLEQIEEKERKNDNKKGGVQTDIITQLANQKRTM